MSIVVGYVDALEGRPAVERAAKQAGSHGGEKLVIVWSDEGGTRPGVDPKQ